jgi:hypothetical protein
MKFRPPHSKQVDDFVLDGNETDDEINDNKNVLKNVSRRSKLYDKFNNILPRYFITKRT